MPFRKTRQRIKQLREEPQEVRLRAATIIIISIGLVLAFIILAILLPLQLFLT